MRVDQQLAQVIGNTLPPVTAAFVTGIVGEAPSKYAKTPPLWNAAYRDLGWDAISVPWDVTPAGLPAFMDAIRGASSVAGFSVTNPHKIAILPLLDDVDPLAKHIGAVNTVARNAKGQLVGYNTDGQGAIDALVRVLPGRNAPFLPTLDGASVLMIGAGGAARAVAFYVAKAIGRSGKLRIVNRHRPAAESLAKGVHAAFGVGEAGDEAHLDAWLPEATLVINASVKGQTGWRTQPDGTGCQLEPYSALAAASPKSVPAPFDAKAARAWLASSAGDIAHNAAAGMTATLRMRPDAACFDLIYAPLETPFLRDARLAGHPTQNGKWMNVAQAADGFARKVCVDMQRRQGLTEDDSYARVFEVMARVW